METITETEKNTTEATSDEGITSPMLPGVVIRPLPEAVQHRVIEGIPELRALRQEILASRGGRPISLEEIVGALHEARATYERQVQGRPISLDEIVNALHEARAAHERGE